MMNAMKSWFEGLEGAMIDRRVPDIRDIKFPPENMP
jgi:hypothetical protein